jgi:choline dehydrogenase-like flavoprotein
MVYDYCVIGSGAGAGPIIYELSKIGAKIVVLEKGDFIQREDFSKDEIAFVRRDIATSNMDEEFHEIEEFSNGAWESYTTKEAGWNFFNGNMVGGSSNYMSGFFHKLQKIDFTMASKLKVKGANLVDWPISYEEFIPFYDEVKEKVGVTTNTREHPMSKYLDHIGKKSNIKVDITPRAVLKDDKEHRNGCYYSNYCGSYGCSSGAKGSSREALIIPALRTGNVTLKANHHVLSLQANKDEITHALVYDKKEKKQILVSAKKFIVACQAVESCRLLLNSKNIHHPNGLGNNYNQVGKNLLFSGGGIIKGEFDKDNFDLEKLMVEGLFVNRSINEWYMLDKKTKGGVAEFLFEHANPIRKANSVRRNDNGNLLWGKELFEALNQRFNQSKILECEIYNDWYPNDNCYVTLSEKKDIYGMPVAKIRIGSHPQNEKTGDVIAKKIIDFYKTMNAKNINGSISPYPPSNLQAGGCRFGNDPKTSVLDINCKVHSLNNLYVTDGSFMPNGGAQPYTYTIYANSFRIAKHLKSKALL